VFEHEGFTFSSRDGGDQWIVPWGEPEGVGKLNIRAGFGVRLPFEAVAVSVRVAQLAKQPVEVIALDAEGEEVGRADTAPHAIEAAGISGLLIEGGGGESAVISICAQPGPPKPPRDPKLGAKRSKAYLEKDRE
jgi:hypothetical protein